MLRSVPSSPHFLLFRDPLASSVRGVTEIAPTTLVGGSVGNNANADSGLDHAVDGVKALDADPDVERCPHSGRMTREMALQKVTISQVSKASR
jgi:hypothetical protein